MEVIANYRPYTCSSKGLPSMALNVMIPEYDVWFQHILTSELISCWTEHGGDQDGYDTWQIFSKT